MGKVKEKESTAVGTGRRVGMVYDERMCNHDTPDGEPHPENPDRIRAIWNHLLLHQIPKRCVVIGGKKVEDKYLLGVHSKKHVKLIKSISTKVFDARRNRTASKFDSIYFNKGSKESAYLAAGSVVEVAERVAKGELNSAAAIVRPPGHHAECEEPMGFCLFNNVAVAASFLLDGKPQLGIKKILIVDWDVHHGNGTQQMFWEDSRVLVFSVHRHDFGNFYPANDDGFYTMIGEGQGAGYNINVPWENDQCGDADYLAVWDHILIPVAKEFDPDMIVVSAGFDAAIGDPLGGCLVTHYGYSVMLKKLMDFAQGRIVLALEGGYNLDSTAKSFLACMEVLLDGKLASGSLEACPFESTWRVIQAVRKMLGTHWSTLADELPLKLTSQKVPSLPSLPEASLSHVSHDSYIEMADAAPSPAFVDPPASGSADSPNSLQDESPISSDDPPEAPVAGHDYTSALSPALGHVPTSCCNAYRIPTRDELNSMTLSQLKAKKLDARNHLTAMESYVKYWAIAEHVYKDAICARHADKGKRKAGGNYEQEEVEENRKKRKMNKKKALELVARYIRGIHSLEDDDPDVGPPAEVYAALDSLKELGNSVLSEAQFSIVSKLCINLQSATHAFKAYHRLRRDIAISKKRVEAQNKSVKAATATINALEKCYEDSCRLDDVRAEELTEAEDKVLYLRAELALSEEEAAKARAQHDQAETKAEDKVLRLQTELTLCEAEAAKARAQRDLAATNRMIVCNACTDHHLHFLKKTKPKRDKVAELLTHQEASCPKYKSKYDSARALFGEAIKHLDSQVKSSRDSD